MLVRALEAQICVVRSRGAAADAHLREHRPRRTAVEPDVHRVAALCPRLIHGFAVLKQPWWYKIGERCGPPVEARAVQGGEDVIEGSRVENNPLGRDML